MLIACKINIGSNMSDPINFKKPSSAQSDLVESVASMANNLLDGHREKTEKADIDTTNKVVSSRNNSGQDLLNGLISTRSKEAGVEVAAARLREIKQYGDRWIKILPDCPCREENVKGSNDFYEVKFNPTLPIFHPGASKEYRSQPRNFYSGNTLISRPAQQCTYDGNGALITRGAGAGTPDFWTSQDSSNHYKYDVQTFQNMNLDTYQSVWKPNQGDGNCGAKNQERER
jgi:hypothetical protein